MNIRKVKPEDYALLRQMAIKCGPLDVHTPYTYWVVGHFFSKGCFFLEEDGEPVGSIMTVSKDRILFVWQIAICKEYRGQGLSDKLYEAVLNYARENGYEKIQLSIDPANITSQSAFKRFCEKRQLEYKENGVVDINIPEENYKEYETIYEVVLTGTV